MRYCVDRVCTGEGLQYLIGLDKNWYENILFLTICAHAWAYHTQLLLPCRKVRIWFMVFILNTKMRERIRRQLISAYIIHGDGFMYCYVHTAERRKTKTIMVGCCRRRFRGSGENVNRTCPIRVYGFCTTARCRYSKRWFSVRTRSRTTWSFRRRYFAVDVV